MKQSTERILTTHVGALPRPPELLRLMERGQRLQGSSEDDYATALKDAVAWGVRQQAQSAVDIVSDGEYGKSNFIHYAHERLSGFERRDTPAPNPRLAGRDRRDFPAFYAETGINTGGGVEMACRGPVRYVGNDLLQRDLQNFKAALSEVAVEEAFVPAIAPHVFGRGENEFYASEEEFVFAVAESMGEEYRAIVDAGFVLQIDTPVGMYDTFDLTIAEFRRRFGMGVEALNLALRDVPSDRVRVHICWGSWHTPHTHDLPLIEFVDQVFGIRAAGISIEAANVRHEHEVLIWEELKLPEGKLLIPGFVSHATNIVEHPELVAWRIRNYARLIGRENVIAGTDCGLSAGRIHPEVGWAKLRALAEGARLASAELW